MTGISIKPSSLNNFSNYVALPTRFEAVTLLVNPSKLIRVTHYTLTLSRKPQINIICYILFPFENFTRTIRKIKTMSNKKRTRNSLTHIRNTQGILTTFHLIEQVRLSFQIPSSRYIRISMWSSRWRDGRRKPYI